MRIIYIEDNPANRALVERVARHTRDTLTTYVTADEALDRIQPGDADLILTDIRFGDGTNGLELAQVLRERGVDAPIVTITAYDLEEYVRWAEYVGSREFLVKPVDVPTLLNLFDSFRPADG